MSFGVALLSVGAALVVWYSLGAAMARLCFIRRPDDIDAYFSSLQQSTVGLFCLAPCVFLSFFFLMAWLNDSKVVSRAFQEQLPLMGGSLVVAMVAQFFLARRISLKPTGYSVESPLFGEVEVVPRQQIASLESYRNLTSNKDYVRLVLKSGRKVATPIGVLNRPTFEAWLELDPT